MRLLFKSSDAILYTYFQKVGDRPNYTERNCQGTMAENKTPNEETNVITLEFDDGTEQECVIIGVFDYNGKDYIALDPEDGTGDAYIYGYREVGDDEFELMDIEDEAEFEAAAKEFDSIING